MGRFVVRGSTVFLLLALLLGVATLAVACSDEDEDGFDTTSGDFDEEFTEEERRSFMDDVDTRLDEVEEDLEDLRLAADDEWQELQNDLIDGIDGFERQVGDLRTEIDEALN